MIIGINMDKLAIFFDHYSFSSKLFFNGSLCGSENIRSEKEMGYLHVIREGALTIHSQFHEPVVITEPSFLFYPKPIVHRFETHKDSHVDLLCSFVDMGYGAGNPILNALPDFVLIPLNEMPELDTMLKVLFMEASQSHCGQQVAINKLMDYMLILVLRYAMDHLGTKIGLLAGLMDKRLSRALMVMHDKPGEHWTLENLSAVAGMSRARFFVHFRDIVGVTPGDYLSQWRVTLAQTLLKQKKPLEMVADMVGYGSATSLSRAFKKHTGFAPKMWKKTEDNATE